VTTARELGEAVKHFRTSAGMTQLDAAETLGVGQPYLSSLEAGKFGRALTHVLRLLGLVGCEVIVRPRAPVKGQRKRDRSQSLPGASVGA